MDGPFFFFTLSITVLLRRNPNGLTCFAPDFAWYTFFSACDATKWLPKPSLPRYFDPYKNKQN